jgi:hypothetical protein
MAAMRPSTVADGINPAPARHRAKRVVMCIRRVHVAVHVLGVISGRLYNQTGPRGRDKFFAPNWFMPMATHRLAGGLFTVRSMFTLEPLPSPQTVSPDFPNWRAGQQYPDHQWTAPP